MERKVEKWNLSTSTCEDDIRIRTHIFLSLILCLSSQAFQVRVAARTYDKLLIGSGCCAPVRYMRPRESSAVSNVDIAHTEKSTVVAVVQHARKAAESKWKLKFIELAPTFSSVFFSSSDEASNCFAMFRFPLSHHFSHVSRSAHLTQGNSMKRKQPQPLWFSHGSLVLWMLAFSRESWICRSSLVVMRIFRKFHFTIFLFL